MYLLYKLRKFLAILFFQQQGLDKKYRYDYYKQEKTLLKNCSNHIKNSDNLLNKQKYLGNQ